MLMFVYQTKDSFNPNNPSASPPSSSSVRLACAVTANVSAGQRCSHREPREHTRQRVVDSAECGTRRRLTSAQYRRPTEETETHGSLMIPLRTTQQLLTPLSRQNKFPDFSANISSIRCKETAPKIMLQFFQTTLRPLFAVQIDFFTVCL